jgi:hypothetical protein
MLLILGPIYDDASKLDFHRFSAHYFGGGNEEVEILIKCLGDSGKRINEGLKPVKASRTLDTLLRAWEIQEINRKLRKDLATAIADVVASGKWKIEDTKKEGCLQKAMASLKNGKFSNLSNNVYIKIRDIERADKTKLWIKRGLLVFFSHLGFLGTFNYTLSDIN